MADNKSDTSSAPTSPGPDSPISKEGFWNASNKAGVTRSPPESPRGSFMASAASTGRRHSYMTPEMVHKLMQRRASLDKLQVEKVSPWMHLYDFTDNDNE